MKYIFAQAASAILLLGMVLGCGKSVDTKLSMQIVSGCDSGEYATLISDINLYCISILNAADNTPYSNQPSCYGTIEKATYEVLVKKLIQDLGSGATVKIVVDGRVNNVVKAKGTSAPIKLDPKKDVEITVPFFRVVKLPASTSTWDGNEFMTLAKDESGSTCAKLPFPAQGHTATLFPSGHVMVVGSGSTLPAGITMAAFLVDPSNRDVLPIQPTNTTTETFNRTGHTASLLSDGRTAIVGGWKKSCLCLYPPTGCACLVKDITVIDGTKMNQSYDPTQDYSKLAVNTVGAMTNGRSGHGATVLHGDQILVNGGWSAQPVLLSGDILSESAITLTTADNPFTTSAAATVFDTAASVFDAALYGNAPNAPTQLNVGVLRQDQTTASTFTFFPADFTAAIASRSNPLGVKYSLNEALYFGGLPNASTDPQVIYLQYRLTIPHWISCGLTVPSGFPTSGYTVTPIPNSAGTAVAKIFVAGGNSATPGSTFYLIPNANLATCPNFTIYSGPNMRMPRTGHTASLLPDGRLILVGGTSTNTAAFSNDQVASSAEVLTIDISQ